MNDFEGVEFANSFVSVIIIKTEKLLSDNEAVEEAKKLIESES